MALKVVKAKEMARIEALSYQAGASEEKFMENAGRALKEAVDRFIAANHIKPKIALLCGSGNNGGDAYVAGYLLKEGDFEVFALSFAAQEKLSPLAKKQADRFLNANGKIFWLEKKEDIDFRGASMLVDGILGTGFHGEVTGFYLEAIDAINRSKLPVLSVDIPSGIDGNQGKTGQAVKAKKTLFLGLPKWGCFIGNAWNFTGKIETHNFGLEEKFIDEAKALCLLLENRDISLPTIKRNRHKYERGYVVGIGGSPGMPGASLLSSFATLRAGAGIVRLFHPIEMKEEFGNAPQEIIREGYHAGDYKSLFEAMKKASALFIGPGIGTTDEARQTVIAALSEAKKPIVIDAEALTLIATHSLPIPEHSILTPHQGEMKRLLHLEKEIPFEELFQRCQDFVDEKNCVLVLKGAPTFIFHKKGTPYVCGRGDPGMATAGSGDVLTGVIAAFATQKSPLDAAITGVYIHAIAGEKAALEKTSYSMIASDITRHLPDALKTIREKD